MGKSWKKMRLLKLKNSQIENVEMLEPSEEEILEFPDFDLSMKKDELIKICKDLKLKLNFEDLTKKQLCEELEKKKNK